MGYVPNGMVYINRVPSGKQQHNELERSTMFNAKKNNYFDWAIFQFVFCIFTRPGNY